MLPALGRSPLELAQTGCRHLSNGRKRARHIAEEEEEEEEEEGRKMAHRPPTPFPPSISEQLICPHRRSPRGGSRANLHKSEQKLERLSESAVMTTAWPTTDGAAPSDATGPGPWLAATPGRLAGTGADVRSPASGDPLGIGLFPTITEFRTMAKVVVELSTTGIDPAPWPKRPSQSNETA